MTDSPVTAPETEPEFARSSGESWSFALPHARPKVVVKADLIPAISILSMISLIGVPLGWLWSRLASPERLLVVSATENPVPLLQQENWHQFDGLVIFALLSLAAGVLTGVIIWLLRERRGPVVLIAAVLGSVLAGWLGMMMASTFANGLYQVSGPPAIGDIVQQAPTVSSAWVLLAQPFAVAFVYGVLAVANRRDDLGRRLG